MKRAPRRGVGLAVLQLLAALTAPAQFSYVTSNGTATITGYSGSGVVVTPKYINTLPVTAIGDYAFSYSGISAIRISEGIRTIGLQAFSNCENLTNVFLPNSLTNIGEGAFAYCPALPAIEIPHGAIGSGAFARCPSLTNVNIGPGVDYVSGSAFGGCSNLENFTVDAANPVYFTLDGVLGDRTGKLVEYPAGRTGDYFVPPGVTSIGSSAFALTQLTSVTIPDSVIEIADNAFFGCNHLIAVTLGNGLRSIGRSAFSNAHVLRSLAIPQSVTNIGSSAFSFCFGLTNVTLSSRITVLPEYTFDNCAITSILLPDGLVEIGSSAFDGTRLQSIHIPNSVTNLGSGAFQYCRDLACVSGMQGPRELSDTVFSGCARLTNVSFSPFITRIGDSAFERCLSLPFFAVPDSVTNIGGGAFRSSGVTNVTFGTNLASIGDLAFYDCPNLGVVGIGRGLVRIGLGAFSHCLNLTAFTVDPQNPAFRSVEGALFNKDGTKLLVFPGGRRGACRVPEGTRIIGTNAFSECTLLTSVVVPASVIALQYWSFESCVGLTALYFQGNAPGIASWVFYGVSNAVAYYVPGTTGWGPTFGGLTTRLWNPQIQTAAADFGVLSNQFGFTICGTSNLTIVVEACTNPANPVWHPLWTNTLTDGCSYFSDSEWTNYPARFYRIRSP